MTIKEWTSGAKAAKGFLEAIEWEFDASAFGQTASPEQSALAKNFLHVCPDLTNDAKLAFELYLGIGV